MMWFYLYLFVVILLGMCLGSFATAMIWRIPKKLPMFSVDSNKDKTHANRSSCPKCNHVLGAIDLVPIFSWAFLKGKCRFCKTSIHIRYPLTELAVTILCIAFYWRFGFSWSTAPLYLITPILVSIIVIDFEHKIIPNILNFYLLIFGFLTLIISSFSPVGSFLIDKMSLNAQDAIIGAFSYFIGAYLLRYVFFKLLKKEALGFGDVKFFGVVGFWLGNLSASYFLIISGGLGVLLALIWEKATKEKTFPFGPALVISLIICILYNGGIFYSLS